MRLIARIGAAIAAAGSIFGLLALAGPGTASATPHGHDHHPVLVDDVNVYAPIDVDIVHNTVNVLGVIVD